MGLQSLDVIATRLWFDKLVKCRFVANVLADFEPDVGSTYFDLNQLQVTEDAPGRILNVVFGLPQVSEPPRAQQ